MEKVVQLADTGRHTQVNGLVTEVHDETTKQSRVNLRRRVSIYFKREDWMAHLVGDL